MVGGLQVMCAVTGTVGQGPLREERPRMGRPRGRLGAQTQGTSVNHAGVGSSSSEPPAPWPKGHP